MKSLYSELCTSIQHSLWNTDKEHEFVVNHIWSERIIRPVWGIIYRDILTLLENINKPYIK